MEEWSFLKLQRCIKQVKGHLSISMGLLVFPSLSDSFSEMSNNNSMETGCAQPNRIGVNEYANFSLETIAVLWEQHLEFHNI